MTKFVESFFDLVKTLHWYCTCSTVNKLKWNEMTNNCVKKKNDTYGIIKIIDEWTRKSIKWCFLTVGSVDDKAHMNWLLSVLFVGFPVNTFRFGLIQKSHKKKLYKYPASICQTHSPLTISHVQFKNTKFIHILCAVHHHKHFTTLHCLNNFSFFFLLLFAVGLVNFVVVLIVQFNLSTNIRFWCSLF